MNKAYNRTYWQNYPSDATPLNETNLNKAEAAIDEIDDRVITLDTTKATKVEVSMLISDVSFKEDTGTIIFTRKNGSTVSLNTKLEKLAINFGYDVENERLVITLDDGSVQYVDISALITQYEFLDSDTLAFSVDGTGKVSAIVKEGSVNEKHLNPDYLADIKLESAKAQSSAAEAEKSALEAENSANEAENSANEAEISAERAEQMAASAGWANFDINEAGHLIFTKTDNLETEFALTENGRLEVTLL